MDSGTIAAITTPPGVGGIGVIRISGPDAADIARQIFRRPDGKAIDLTSVESHRLLYGTIDDPETGERIEIDSNNRRLRERFAAAERRDRDHIASELRRLRVEHVVLSTDRDWLFDLGRVMR